ncbi:MAG: aldehyde dehydrogenase family protein [Alphaproteobacteria bacterium]
MPPILKTISPVDGTVFVERPLANDKRIAEAIDLADKAQAVWRAVPIAERGQLISAAVDAFVAKGADIAREITWQMGRPIKYAPGEVRGFEERARYMISVAEGALADVDVGPKQGFRRFIRKVPLGIVFVVAPWNYPYLTAVNAVIPALMAGNAVILKHSHQTPLCAERFAEAFAAAGLPIGVFQHLHVDHDATARIIRAPEIDFVAFTGSVPGGKAIEQAAAGRFIGTGLELGGKDPAYVRADANMAHAVENLVDGVFFNSGQSCCGIERIYVHKSVFKDFVDGAAALTKQYVLGDPTDAATTLGPMVRTQAADFVREQIAEAVKQGAKPLIDGKLFARDASGTPYLAPQILINVDHSMRVMTEESFGPVVGIMPVESDEEAIRLMNDSAFGLTAAIWTGDEAAAIRIGDRIETGTWFMNRCDYLDPALAWTGVKQSGRGCTLSALGYDYVTRPKSFHLRVAL